MTEGWALEPINLPNHLVCVWLCKTTLQSLPALRLSFLILLLQLPSSQVLHSAFSFDSLMHLELGSADILSSRIAPSPELLTVVAVSYTQECTHCCEENILALSQRSHFPAEEWQTLPWRPAWLHL